MLDILFYIIPLLTFIIIIVFVPTIYRRCKRQEEIVYYSDIETYDSESV